ncbi:MAG: ATP-binding protein [Desulfobacterales bacterium]
MRELSLHLLDLAENAVTAGARRVSITVEESPAEDRLTIRVADDGPGLPEEKLRRLEDPFVTSRTTRRVGLGLSLLAAAARRAGGGMTVRSTPGKGTEVTARFRYHHIDRAPLGDVAATVATLIAGYPAVDFVYRHRIEEREIALDTRELRAAGEGLDPSEPAVAEAVARWLRDQLLRSAPGEEEDPDAQVDR